MPRTRGEQQGDYKGTQAGGVQDTSVDTACAVSEHAERKGEVN